MPQVHSLYYKNVIRIYSHSISHPPVYGMSQQSTEGYPPTFCEAPRKEEMSFDDPLKTFILSPLPKTKLH